MKLRKIISSLIILVFGILIPNKVEASDVLFEDNFEQENTSEWFEIQGASFQRAFVEDSIRLGIKLATYSSISEIQAGNYDWTDYNFAFDILPLSGQDKNVFFRVNNNRSSSVPGLNLPVGYGLHMYPDHIWLQKWTINNSYEPVNLPFSIPNNTITHIDIRVTGNKIMVFANDNSLPTINYTDNDNPILGGRIGLAATSGSSTSEVWFDNIVVTDLSSTPTPNPTETPRPTPVLTPTPTPTPTEAPNRTPTPTPTPITKLFFIPGLGASWNLNAFMTCDFDPNPKNWSLASYASDIYTPLITSIKKSGPSLNEVYYDWRSQIQDNSSALANIIGSSNLDYGEKINIFGHSMGGLVGIDYLINHPENVAKFVAVGSPFKGSSLAYPAWEGGDIWNDNFITKIAMTLYIKHCGSIWNLNSDKDIIQNNIPSIGNLLPTFNYLRDHKTLSWVNPTYAQNTWTNSKFDIPEGPTVETISGTGFATISEIPVKPPNKKDVEQDIWHDGRPAGKIYSIDGDGTVLSASSKLPGVNNITLNQDHSGLISSQEGIDEILNFLGISNNKVPPTNQTKVNSQLIIISYPSTFWTLDSSGKTQKDKDGMISITNPKSGYYQLSILPRTYETTTIIAQFLPNGDVKYKEYKLSGFSPKFKTLNFNTSVPSEDILN